MWPPLAPDVYLRKAWAQPVFPLDRPDCRLYARARHALWCGCKAIGLGSGDVVLAPAYHHGSEIEALLRAGVEVRYFDVTAELEPDPAELDRLLGPRVRVLFLIHFLGFPQEAARWRDWCDERGLLLFEDAAQAWLATRDGIPVGSHGDLAIFCMYKTIGVPDGAAVLCHPSPPISMSRRKMGSTGLVKSHGSWIAQTGALEATVIEGLAGLAERFDRGRSHSMQEEFDLGDPTERQTIAAASILSKAYHESIAHQRRTNYRYLLERLSEWVPAPFASLPDGASPFAFPVEADEPEDAVKDLRARGVKALMLWRYPHPSLAGARFPAAMRLRETVIALPVHQELTSARLRQIAEAARKVLV